MTSIRGRALPESRPDNEALLILCRVGDQDAWNMLVDRYERLVYAIPLRENLTPDQAGEVAQETFGALFRSLHQIEDPDRLASWLATVARRHTWRIRHDKSATRTRDLEDNDASVDDETDSITRALWVYDAVEQLEDPCRSLVRALFFDPAEPSYGEVAVKLGRPLGSVGPLRARCLQRLRALLEARA